MPDDLTKARIEALAATMFVDALAAWVGRALSSLPADERARQAAEMVQILHRVKARYHTAAPLPEEGVIALENRQAFLEAFESLQRRVLAAMNR